MKGRKHNSATKISRMGISGKGVIPDSGNPAVTDAAKGKTIGMIGGGLSRMRLDRPGRKRGGRVGADKAPLSSAGKTALGEA